MVALMSYYFSLCIILRLFLAFLVFPSLILFLLSKVACLKGEPFILKAILIFCTFCSEFPVLLRFFPANVVEAYPDYLPMLSLVVFSVPF